MDPLLLRDPSSSEPGTDLVSKKKSNKKKRHNDLHDKLPFPKAEPCGKGALVGGLISIIEEDKKGHFWMQRDPDKVTELGEMLKRNQREVGVNQPNGDEGVKVGSAVVAEWDEDGTLNRGVVVSKSGSRLQVHFVDWGNSDFVAKSRVRLAHETELQEPTLAIR